MAFSDTGCPVPWRPSWISIRTPYSAFVVKIIGPKAYQRGRSYLRARARSPRPRAGPALFAALAGGGRAERLRGEAADGVDRPIRVARHPRRRGAVEPVLQEGDDV